MQDYLMTGIIRYKGMLKRKNDIENVITMKEIKPRENFTEHDLIMIKD